MIRAAYMRARRKLCALAGSQRGVSRWTNRLQTARMLPRLRRHFSAEVPPGVNLEINTDCNYQCPFCPQSSWRRPARYITMAGFRQVVAELAALNYAGSLVLSVNNEPFLHPLLVDFCAYASANLPHATTALVSNGALITEAHIAALSRLARPPRIDVDDYTPDQRVNNRLRTWLSRTGNNRLPVTLKTRSWFEVLSNRAGNQPGQPFVPDDYRRVTCGWPFGSLFLTPELKVFLCCSDYRYEMMVGDLNRQSLMEIWEGEPLQRVREALLVPDRSQIALCARCDAEWWCLPEHCCR